MGILYYPWQYFTSIAPPYWEKFANTVSGNFHVSWIMCCTVTVWIVETVWGRYPFNLIKRNWLRRLVAFFGIIAIAFAMHFFLYFVQELTWGPAIRGTRRAFAPDWRWLHISPFEDWDPKYDDLVLSLGKYGFEKIGCNHGTGILCAKKFISAGYPVISR